MNRSVLVTGGAGFIGSELVHQLVEMGRRVTIVDNFSTGRREFLPSGVRTIRGDIRDSRSLRKAFDQSYREIFHLAALHFIPYCNAHPKETVSVNLHGTLRLLEFLRRRPPARFFFASTAAVYGPSSRRHRETDAPAPADIYGISKLDAENAVVKFQRETATPTVIGRYFNAYGPRETSPHLIPSILEQLKNKKRTIRLGNLTPRRNYIHVSDVALATVRSLTATRKGMNILNIDSGHERTVRQVARIILSESGRDVKILSVPRLKRPTDRPRLRADCSKIRRLTGFRPKVSFRRGIRDLLAFEGLLPT